MLAVCNTAAEVWELARRRAEWRKAQYAKPVSVPVVVPIAVEEPAPVFVPVVVIGRATETADKVRVIKGTIRNHFELTEAELTSDRRSIRQVFPRHVAMFFIGKYTKLSLPAIGRLFRGRDHTTVLHAICTIREKRYLDPQIGAVISYFDDIIGGHLNVD